MEDDADYCIVRFYGKEGGIDLLIRRKYQWDAQTLKHQWEYLAEGLTEEQAMKFIKLFEGA
jgi:hypothetical protein